MGAQSQTAVRPERSVGPGASISRPRALIVTGDGLNCEEETAHAFLLGGAEPCLVHITDLLDREKRLGDYQVLAFIGGFSNGDHLGAGTVQACRFRHGLRDDLERFIESGRPIIGICNGFQTLVKMGVLPGPEGGERFRRTATIMENDSGRFEDRWVTLRVERSSPCVWTRGLETLFLPVRHGEGKFVAADEGRLARMRERGEVVMTYADPTGRKAVMEYPLNPNGSAGAVAGICDATGAVFGLMPHPEAHVHPCHHPAWIRETALGRPLPVEGPGAAVFRNGVRHAREVLG
jgi:phosphoribosylformylglycinamidine synthase subunit PurQ / glutaminase